MIVYPKHLSHFGAVVTVFDWMVKSRSSQASLWPASGQWPGLDRREGHQETEGHVEQEEETLEEEEEEEEEQEGDVSPSANE